MKKSKKIVAIFIVVIFVFSLGTTTSFSSRLKDISRKIDNAETKLKNELQIGRASCRERV